MHVPAVVSGSSAAAYWAMPGAQVARLGWRVIRANSPIHGQADRVPADKWE